jgi:hypothetical protein
MCWVLQDFIPFPCTWLCVRARSEIPSSRHTDWGTCACRTPCFHERRSLGGFLESFRDPQRIETDQTLPFPSVCLLSPVSVRDRQTDTHTHTLIKHPRCVGQFRARTRCKRVLQRFDLKENCVLLTHRWLLPAWSALFWGWPESLTCGLDQVLPAVGVETAFSVHNK